MIYNLSRTPVIALLTTLAVSVSTEADPPQTTFAQSTTLANDASPPGNLRAYVGTYARGDSQGIYALELDLATGALQAGGVASGVENPSFLAIHPNKRYLYAVNEIGRFEGEPTGSVTAFAITPDTGSLERLNQQPSMGTGPCHIVVDRSGRNVLVANYGGGSVAVLPIASDGQLGPPSSAIQHEGSSVNPRRQKGPHAHSINLDASNRFAFVADLGLDKVLIYRFDTDHGRLQPNDPAALSVAPGAGPRHFDFHPNGRFAYVINELASSVTAMRYAAPSGELTSFQSITTLPPDFEDKNSTADIHVHPSGQFLYGSNRGHDSIAIFSIDAGTGRLTSRGHAATRGKTPRNFAIDPTGAYLLAANQATNNIVAFRIDQETGLLTPTNQAVDIPSPVCIQFLSAGDWHPANIP